MAVPKRSEKEIRKLKHRRVKITKGVAAQIEALKIPAIIPLTDPRFPDILAV